MPLARFSGCLRRLSCRRSVPTAQWCPGLCPSPVPPCPHRAPPLELVAAAVTARSALECADLERLETLGDAYLKFAVRWLLHRGLCEWSEGQSRLQTRGSMRWCAISRVMPAPHRVFRPHARSTVQVSAQLFSAHRQYHEGQLTKRKVTTAGTACMCVADANAAPVE